MTLDFVNIDSVVIGGGIIGLTPVRKSVQNDSSVLSIDKKHPLR